MANGSGQRRGQPIPRSHEEIYEGVERVERKADEANAAAKKVQSDLDIYALTLQRIEGAVADIALDVGHLRDIIGKEGEPTAEGARDGVGMVGFMLRLDTRITKRFGIYDGWTRTVLGGAIVAGVLIPAFWAVVWWLTSARLGAVLK